MAARSSKWPPARRRQNRPRRRASAPLSIVAGEKPPELGDKILRVVALHRVTGARDGDELAMGQALRQADAVFLVENVALAAAHDQRRAGDALQPIGELGALGSMRLLIEPLKPAAVVFPFPAAVRLLPQIVHQAAAQDPRLAARIEFQRLLDDRLDGDGVLHVVAQIADAATSL